MRRDIFQAIADPTRRAIIVLIALQAMTPTAIAEHFDTTRQAVSKHLRILTECELIKQEHKGREIFYQLEIDKMKEIDKWLEQFRQIGETPAKSLLASFSVSYELLQNLFIDAGIANRTHSVEGKAKASESFFSMGLRWNIGKREFEF